MCPPYFCKISLTGADGAGVVFAVIIPGECSLMLWSTRSCCSSIKVHPLLHLLGCPSCWSSLTHTQKPAWEWHLAHVEHRGKQRKIAREQPSKFKSLVKEIALLTTHSDAPATASDLPQSGIKTEIRVKDAAQRGYKYFFSIAASKTILLFQSRNTEWDLRWCKEFYFIFLLFLWFRSF